MTKTWTVLGVWLNNQAVSVGVIEGEHAVHGGNSAAFGAGSADALVEDGQGLWFTSVDAPDAKTAEALAVEEMEHEDAPAFVWNEHTNELGDWCPWSGKSIGNEDPDNDPACPAGCPASHAEEADDEDLMIRSSGLLKNGDQT